MLKKYQKYAPIGLIIGLVAAITSLILRFTTGQLSLAAKISFGISILGLVVYIGLDARSILAFFKSRHAKFGGNSLVLILAVIGILVIVNLFIYNNDISWDLTEDKVNSLAPETVDILSNLQVPIKAQAFYSSSTSSEGAEILMRNFERNAEGFFTYEFIDPYNDPVAATQAGIDRDGVIILYAGDQTEQITSVTEEKLINAFIKLQNPIETVIYTLTGHGEGDFEEYGDLSFTDLQSAMESKNYKVEPLNLVATPAIPDDAEAIFIVAPQVPLEQDEVDLISEFLAEGGSLILFSEPDFLTNIGDQADPLTGYLEETWGISLGKDLVIDTSVDPVEFAIANEYGDHTILDEVSGYVTFFPTSRSLTITEVSGVTNTELVLTSSQSWAETDVNGVLNGEAGYDEDDTAGPITLAVALVNSSTGGRVVIVGDSDFANDSYSSYYANLDLAIGIVDWAAENEALISITSAEETTRILVAPTKATKLAIILGGLVGIPLFIAVTGIIIAIHRKRTG